MWSNEGTTHNRLDIYSFVFIVNFKVSVPIYLLICFLFIDKISNTVWNNTLVSGHTWVCIKWMRYTRYRWYGWERMCSLLTQWNRFLPFVPILSAVVVFHSISMRTYNLLYSFPFRWWSVGMKTIAFNLKFLLQHCTMYNVRWKWWKQQYECFCIRFPNSRP